MGITWSLFFPPKPTLTAANLPNQKGKVFIVTGGYSGIGFELCRILYQAGGKVYLAGRSEEKAQAAIAKIKALASNNRTSESSTEVGDIVFLSISLDDLQTIKPAVDTFTAAESRLDVLFNNAGVSNPPRGSVSPQGHELQFATNCLGPHLLTQLLLPTLRNTARSSPSTSVRVIWTGSIVVDLAAPKGGPSVTDFEHPSTTDQQQNYTNSKIGNWYLANELANQVGGDGILSLAQNPGNLKTALTRHMPAIVPVLVAPLLYTANYGAYTALWAAFSNELTIDDGGKYVLPWGRLHPSPRADLLAALKSGEDGTTSVAASFVEFCDRKIADFK